jgi:ribose transport system permease protein
MIPARLAWTLESPTTRARLRYALGWAQRNGLFFGLVFLVLAFSLASPHFFTRSNLSVVLSQVAVIGLVGVPQAMLLLTGYVDLSVGSVAVLTAISFGEFNKTNGMPVPLAAILAMVVALLCGVISGVLIAYFDFSPIVVTLAGLAGLRGIAELVSKAETKFQFGSGFAELGGGSVASIGIPVLICAIAFIVGGYLWYQAPFGRHMVAIGVDRPAARSAGINIERIPFLLYIASAGAAGLGGLIYTSELDASSLAIGQGLELQVLTAVLLGGVSFLGGYGSLFGVLMGVLFIGVLNNGLVLVNVSPFIKNVAIGAVLLMAAAVDVVYRRLGRVQIPDADEPLADDALEEAPPEAATAPDSRL